MAGGMKYADLVDENGDLKAKDELMVTLLRDPDKVFMTLMELKGLIRASARQSKTMREGDWGGTVSIEEEIVRAQKAHDDMTARRAGWQSNG